MKKTPRPLSYLKLRDKTGRAIADPASSVQHIGYQLTTKSRNLYQNPRVLAVSSAARCSSHFLPHRSGTVSSTSKIDSKEIFGGAFLSYSGEFINRLAINTGLRIDYLHFNEKATLVDVSPRFSTKFLFSDKTNIRAAYGHFYQVPGDEGLMQTTDLNSNKCIHYILGIDHTFNPAFSPALCQTGTCRYQESKKQNRYTTDSLGTHVEPPNL